MAQITLNSSGVASNGSLLLQSNGTTTAVTVDASQNVGVGVTPSAWGGSFKALQVGLSTSLYNNTTGNGTFLGSNFYWNGSNNIYINSNFATAYGQTSGSHQWFTAATGTAGGTVTFTQAMTLDASGNLVIGGTSSQSSSGRTYFTIGGVANGSLAFKDNANVLDAFAQVASTTFDIYTNTSKALAFGTNGTERARITSGGDLLVGATSQGTYASRMTLSTDSGTTKWSTGPYNTSTAFIIAANGTFGVYLPSTSATSWSSASDERVKTDLEPIENAIQKVSTLRAVTGRYKSDDNGVRKAFLIAQDVLAVLPEAVDTTDPEKYGLAYTDVIPLLVAAIKEQQAIITQLQADVAALKGTA